MQFASTVYGDHFGAGVLAVTLINSSGNSIVENDVLFNTANKFNSYRGTTTEAGTQGFFDLHRIAIHELGHVLGLDHPDEAGQNVVAIMNAYVSTIDRLAGRRHRGRSLALRRAAPTRRRPPDNRRSSKSRAAVSVETGDNVMIGGFIIQRAMRRKKSSCARSGHR